MVPVGMNTNRTISQSDDTAALLRGDDFGEWKAPELPPTMESLIGRVIDDRFEVRDILGQGGMGTVYEAYQPAVKRSVAIKVMRREFSENADIMRRFHREALAASRLHHPNIISIYDFGQTEDVVYIAMEHLRGRTLGDAINDESPMNPKRVIHIALQVARSLHEAQGAGIVHRDLKPENIFLIDVEGDADFVKVLDFGVAKLRTPGSDTTVTQAGTLFGTPKYMAPEQTQNQELDHRADIYSLGIIMYEMLMGSAPFEGDNPLAVLLSHASETVPRFKERQPELDLDSRIEGVVFKAIAKKRDERYPVASALVEELEKLQGMLDGDGVIHEFPLVEAIAAEDDGESAVTVMADNPWPLRIGLGLGLGAILLLLTIINQPDAPPTPSSPSPVAELPEELTTEEKPTEPSPAPKRTVSVKSEPANAQIVVKETGAIIGQTPVPVELMSTGTYVVKKNGFKSETIVLGPEYQGDVLMVTLSPITTPSPTPAKVKTPRPKVQNRLTIEKKPTRLEPVDVPPTDPEDEVIDELD